MTRQYIKLDPNFPDRKDYYPDGAFRALVTVFCTASYQPQSGYFRSERVLKALLGKHAKWLGFLVDERDLEPARDGGYHVVGWEAWQEGKFPTLDARMSEIRSHRRPMTPAERAYAYRVRRKERDALRDESPDVTLRVTRDVRLDVTLPLPDVTTPRDGVTDDQDQEEERPTSEFQAKVQRPRLIGGVA